MGGFEQCVYQLCTSVNLIVTKVIANMVNVKVKDEVIVLDCVLSLMT